MSADVANKRAEATARTRTAIIEAATRVFAEQGFGATSLRDIAAATGISHPGLLRHFASKDLLLQEVVARANDLAYHEFSTIDSRLDTFVQVAKHNATIPGYVELFSGLLGVAASTDHPAHAGVAAHYAEVRVRFTKVFERDLAQLSDHVDPATEAVCFAAAWDGLQLISLYLPEVDVAGALAKRVNILRGDHQLAETAAVGAPYGPVEAPEAPSFGYAVGRQRRTQILQAATELFAQSGYHGTSLRDIADQVGTGKSTLVHHFGSKEALLIAVLDRRDAKQASMAGVLAEDTASQLPELPSLARRSADEEPGLIELYATLSTEAAALSHPAHGYFEARYRQAIGLYSQTLEQARQDGAMPAWRDPSFEALWLVALWDGLQLQWLYDPDHVSVAALLDHHLSRLLPVG